MKRKERRSFSDEFKRQMVTFYESGKPRAEIVREYDLTPSSLRNWFKQYNNSGVFKLSVL